MHYRDDSVFCFYCEEIALEDKRLEEEAKNMIHRRKLLESSRMFDDASLINDRLKVATFDNYHPEEDDLKKAKRHCERYAENFSFDNPVNLLLMGSYGTGKSHLAVSIVKELVDKRINSIFISVPMLMTKIKSTFNRNSDVTELSILRTIQEVDCLVLDDIGAEQTKKAKDDEVTWAVSKLWEIIDGRAGKHTIYTTNYDPEGLGKILGARNFSRMMEGIYPIKMYGKDYRLKAFEK
ncbi:ATP-binding protein [Paenalkalicoccus suaedae]|uniref:ATP-binding protein n=2 Tax=Paenalkalicoccus suaedae TaxID=2592382 RepID=A0A859FHJ8_9BACI|nr:ATP-binding protein [Paenalkalicoccus suaedae]QKS71739.1 ATP-binding protein [Paenalkalicoccus suaedae]